MKAKILLLTLSLLATAALTGCKPHESDHSPATPSAESSAPTSSAPTLTNANAVTTPAATNSMPVTNPTNTSPGSTNQ